MFSLLGFALLSDEERAIFDSADTTDPVWLEQLDSASAIGKKLLVRIPRLETVAKIIGDIASVDGKSPWLASDYKPDLGVAGATLLRLALHVERIADDGVHAEYGVGEIRIALPGLSDDLEAMLLEAWPDYKNQPVVNVRFTQLDTGMVLAEDVITNDGAILVRKGRRITETIAEKLQRQNVQELKKIFAEVYEHSVKTQDQKKVELSIG